jgi:cbb3-type cytochrome oxidase subunit 3
MVLALADERDPVREVARSAALLSLTIAFAVVVAIAIYSRAKARKAKQLSGRRRHREHH